MKTLPVQGYDRDAVMRKLESLVGSSAASRVAPALEQVLAARDAVAFTNAERAVHEVMRELADDVVALGLQAAVLDPAFEQDARKGIHERARAAGQPMKSHGRHLTPVRLLGGTEIKVLALKMQPETPKDRRRVKRSRRRGKLGRGVYPTLAALGVSGFSTPALRAEVAYAMASANSMSAARTALRRRGLNLPHKMFLRLGYEFAECSLLARRDRLVNPQTPATNELVDQHVFVSIDGGRLRLRVSATHGRRNGKGHRRYDAPWREPKVLTIYVGDAAKKKAQCIVIEATMGGADDAVALLVGHLRLRGGAQCASLTLVADGAHWIWNRAEQIREAVSVPNDRFRQIVDFYHVVQQLSSVAEAHGWPAEERRTYLNRCRRRLRAGSVGLVLDELLALRGKGLSEEQAAVDKVLIYFDNHDTRMGYDEARKANLPLGSGSVESAVRRVVNQRMKSTGTFWLEEHAEAVLHLRAHIKADGWDRLVRETLQRPVWSPLLDEAA